MQCCLNDTRANTAPGKFPTVGLSSDAAPHALMALLTAGGLELPSTWQNNATVQISEFGIQNYIVAHNGLFGATNVDVLFDPDYQRNVKMKLFG